MEKEISGARIKELRIERGMNADEFGKLIGKNRATVYRYEDGSIDTIPIGIVRRMAEILDVSPSYIMGFSDEPTPLSGKRAKSEQESEKYHEAKERISKAMDDFSESEIQILLQTVDLLSSRSDKK